ncbi:hypothetical protein JCM12681A_37580 [Streptomyces mexicanus]
MVVRSAVARLSAVGLAGVALVGCLAAAVPGPRALAVGTTGPYALAGGARAVAGATTTTAVRLEPGRTHRGSLPRGGRQTYRLDLDAVSTAYVAATATPRPGSRASATDGLRVSVRDAQGATCSYQVTRFGTGRSAHPIAAWGTREISPGGSLCQGAGRYSVLVERIDTTGAAPDSGSWPLELTVVTEPPLRRAGATSAPRAWDSATPAPVAGRAVERAGGAGFATASALGTGVWRDRIRPGQTLFYRVPVDWGRHLDATAELAAAGGGSGYTDGALTLSLYNPVRGFTEEAYVGYSGRPASAALAPLPPVAYANRYGFTDPVRAMRFAGSYYLAVHLAAQTADTFGEGPYGLTLRVRVAGTARPAPEYAGRSEPPGLFEVTAEDRRAATPAGTAGDAPGLRVLAVGGIGGGTVLLAVLGAWTALARRRAGAG